MPLVVAYHKPEFYLAEELEIACEEIVPAAFNSPMGKLSPGNIMFAAFPNLLRSKVDVLVTVEAMHYADRENLDRRAGSIKAGLHFVFPDHKFAIWPKLVQAGWATDVPDEDFVCDMGMQAAAHRALDGIAALRYNK